MRTICRSSSAAANRALITSTRYLWAPPTISDDHSFHDYLSAGAITGARQGLHYSSSGGLSRALASARLAAWRSADSGLACGPAARSLAATATGLRGFCDGSTRNCIFCRVARALFAIASSLQRVARQVFVDGQRVEPRVDVGRVDDHRLAARLGGRERQLLEQLFHHRVQAARADVLGALVDREGDFGQPVDALGSELDLHVLGRQQRLVLLGQAGVGAG